MPRMVQKRFVTANQVVRDSFMLARMILDSGFRPDVLLVLWRGGTPVGIAVHEFLHYQGIHTWHTAIKAESYTGIGKRREPVINDLSPVLANVKRNSRVLVVDDIFDTGCTVKKVKDCLMAKTCHVRIATLYYKKSHNLTDLGPDYFVRETSEWIVFPHELMGLTKPEILLKDRFLHRLLSRRPGGRRGK